MQINQMKCKSNAKEIVIKWKGNKSNQLKWKGNKKVNGKEM